MSVTVALCRGHSSAEDRSGRIAGDSDSAPSTSPSCSCNRVGRQEDCVQVLTQECQRSDTHPPCSSGKRRPPARLFRTSGSLYPKRLGRWERSVGMCTNGEISQRIPETAAVLGRAVLASECLPTRPSRLFS